MHTLRLSFFLLFLHLFLLMPFRGKAYSWQYPFDAWISLTRTDAACSSQQIKKIYLSFGLKDSSLIAPSLPFPPSYCFHACFDPNNTTCDDLKVESPLSTGDEYGWSQAILSYPEEKASWSIVAENVPNAPPASMSFKVEWGFNTPLYYGHLRLTRGECAVLSKNMNAESSCSIENFSPGEYLKIRYFKNSCGDSSLLSVICIGGEDAEINWMRRGLANKNHGEFTPFFNLGNMAYYRLREHTSSSKEDIQYIFYYPDYPGILNSCINPNSPIPQKKRLKEAITSWPVERWSRCMPNSLILFIDLVDHGWEISGPRWYIAIDPNYTSEEKHKLYPEELVSWLEEMNRRLSEKGIGEDQYEVILLIEACYSNGFGGYIWDKNNDPGYNLPDRLVIITSAQEKANVGTGASFSYHFWQKMQMQEKMKKGDIDLKQMYDYASSKVSEQYPQYPNFRYNHSFYPKDAFFFNTQKESVAAGSGFLGSFDITSVRQEEYSHDQNQPVCRSFQFTVTIDPNYTARRAWMMIRPPGCLSESCSFVSNQYDPNCYTCSGNQCTISPDYCFYLPGEYQAIFYVIAQNEERSLPHFEFIDTNIPVITDSYEPDNASRDARLFLDPYQDRSFHDQNDVDTVKFLCPEGFYQISLKPLCPRPFSLIDPNLSPFYLTVSIDGNSMPLTFHHDDKDDSYNYSFNCNRAGEAPSLAYLSIRPSNTTYDAFFYTLRIDETSAGRIFIIGNLIACEVSLRDDIQKDAVFLKPAQKDETCYPDFFNDPYTIQSDYFIFDCLYNDSDLKDIHVWRDVNDLGPLPYFGRYRYDNLGLYELLFSYTDSDCDGILDKDETTSNPGNPNIPEIRLYPGLNLFRYPLWTGCGFDISDFFFRSSCNDYKQVKSICTYRADSYSANKRSWEWYPDANISGIGIYDTDACLIYLNPNTSLKPNTPLTALLKDPDNPYQEITCLAEKVGDPNNCSVALNTGLNFVSFIGYNACIPGNDQNYQCTLLKAENPLNSHSTLLSLIDHDYLSILNPGASPCYPENISSSLHRYDNDTGKWEHSAFFFGKPTGIPFEITRFEGYMLYIRNGPIKNWIPCYIIKP